MAIPLDEKKAKALLVSRGYVVVSPRVVSKEAADTEVKRVVSIIGSRSKIADALGISRMAVYAWDKTGHVPRQRALQLVQWARNNAPECADSIAVALDIVDGGDDG